MGWTEYREVIADARWGWLLVALPLAAVGMASVGMVWRRIIIALGGEVSRPGDLRLVPAGPDGQVPARRGVADGGPLGDGGAGGLRRSLAYNSVALSMGSAYLCATLVSVALLPALIV